MGGAWWFVKRATSPWSRGALPHQGGRLTKGPGVLAYGWIVAVLLLVLSPHLGLLGMSLFKVWSFSILPEQFTLQHYQTVFHDAQHMLVNTFLYCGLAALRRRDLGTAIAYIVLRTSCPGGSSSTTWSRGARDAGPRARHRLPARLPAASSCRSAWGR
jgi:iron(III) transport system permease protein